jgi:hypothetical protein
MAAAMTNVALRIYTAAIALICGAAVAWSIHQSSITTAWQADARSWHSLATRAVAHDRLAARRMHQLDVRYNRLVIRTRRSQRKLVASIAKAEQAGAAAASVPTAVTSAVTLPTASAPAPVAVAPPPAPTTHTSPAP